MGVGDILSQTGIKLPSGLGANASNFIQGFIVFLIICILVGVATWYFLNKKQYNKYIHLFEEVSGAPIPNGVDRAKEIILPGTSIRAIYLQKRKVFLPRPSIQTGAKHYWYFIRNDGEWINVGLENLNERMDKLNIHFDHTDMRMANASLRKLIEKNYKKLNWLKEWAPYIGFGVLILMLGITAFLVIRQANDAVSVLASTASTNKDVVQSLNNILGSIDNVCTGSGIKQVG